MSVRKILVLLLLIALFILLWFLFHRPSVSPTVSVRCSSEKTLADFIDVAEENQRFELIGDCSESKPVVVRVDGVVIDGKGKTVTGNRTDPVIQIAPGVKNVVVKNITLTGGGDGFRLESGKIGDPSTAALSNVKAIANIGNGIVIGTDRIVKDKPGPGTPNQDSITVPISHCGKHCKDSGGGIRSTTMPVLKRISLIRPALAMADCTHLNVNDGPGTLNVTSGAKFCGYVYANNNTLHGISIVNISETQVVSGTDVRAKNNTKNGIQVLHQSSVSVYDAGTEVDVRGSGSESGFHQFKLAGGSTINCDSGVTIFANNSQISIVGTNVGKRCKF